MSDVREIQLQKRIDAVQQAIQNQRTAAARANTLILFVAILILGAMGFYFWHGYTVIKPMLDPGQMVAAGSQMLSEQLPEIRVRVEGQLIASAPEWAEQATVQLVASIPDGRAKLEDIILSQIENQLDEATLLTADQFRAFVKANKAELREGFTQLSASPNEAEQLLESLVPLIEQEIGADMKTHADDALYLITDLRDKLEDLKEGKQLDDRQSLERQILMIARRLEREQADPRFKEASEKSTESKGSRVIGVLEHEPDAEPESAPKADEKAAAVPLPKKEEQKSEDKPALKEVPNATTEKDAGADKDDAEKKKSESDVEKPE